MNNLVNTVIAPGSSLYYSLRFIEPKQREAISLLFAFSHEIEKIVTNRRETEIAQRKLAWWQQELVNLAAGNPTHPLTQALAPILTDYAISTNILNEILAGIGRRLTNPNYPDFKAFSEQHYRAISSFPLLVSLITTPSLDQRPLKFIHDLGITLQTIEVIHELRVDLLHGYIYLPEQDLTKFAVNEHDLLELKSSSKLIDILQQLADQARHYYHQALSKLALNQKTQQLPSLILAKLYIKLLDEVEKDQFQVLKHKITLPPLRKLWLAWREHLKH